MLSSNSYLAVPCHWNTGVVDEMLKADQSNGVELKEVYGAMAVGGPVGHGRMSETVVNVAQEEAIAYRQYVARAGLKGQYVEYTAHL